MSSEDEKDNGSVDFENQNNLAAKVNNTNNLADNELAIKSTKLSIKTSKKKKSLSSATIEELQAPKYEADDFFAEEAETIPVGSIPEVNKSQGSMRSFQGRGYSRGGRGGRKNNIGRPFHSSEGRELTKQESRLVSWQQGARGRGYRGNRGDRQHSEDHSNNDSRRYSHAQQNFEAIPRKTIFPGQILKSNSAEKRSQEFADASVRANKKTKFSDS